MDIGPFHLKRGGGLARSLLILGILVVALGVILGGCSSGSETTTTAGGGSSSTDTTAPAAVKTGGVLKVGSQAATNLDPHFSTSIADIMLNHQVYDWLVEIDSKNQPAPGLATKWDSPDGKVWTFELRSGVKFHNGADFTADDVVYTFNRLRDEKVGAPTVALYKNITDIKATDPTHVVFTLATPNPEFPSDVGDYHAAILSKDVADPSKEWVGTGPFMIESYLAEDRAVLKKNPNYWMTDEAGTRLPYLDGVEFIFSPDIGGQVEALRGGEVQFVPGLTAELADTVKADPNLKLIDTTSNMHFVIHMRSDKGHVAADPKVRQALQLGTDHQGIIDQVRPGLAVVGNGTPVGPSYGDYYLDKAPVYDPEKAKALLAEAGYANGLNITLFAQQALDVPAIATVWKDQMAKIGVNVDIQTVPTDVYYGEGDASWLTVDFGITDWGTRATPVTYFKLAYTAGGDYNESHWTDPEFEEITKQIDSEMDRQKRVDLYQRAQEILIERGPVIVPYMEMPVAGTAANVEGINLATDWARTLFRTANFVN
ncbi:MAG: ABC transporter substrate-binding protein [Thermoleophilia bacterium]